MLSSSPLLQDASEAVESLTPFSGVGILGWTFPTCDDNSFKRFSNSATLDLLGLFFTRGGAGGREKHSFFSLSHLIITCKSNRHDK